MIKSLRPIYFFIGILFGFIACSITGYIVSQTYRYHHFVRFFTYIGPALDYYPTASELLVTAKHEVDRDKILVLIGGSSIFRGEGQNEDDLWSQRLQNLLGDKFKVLNYGFNGAQFAAFGGVAFRMLSEQFPKIIFVSTCTFAGEENAIDGGKLYGYLFWDAYYKNMFHPDQIEKRKIRALRKKQIITAEGAELHLMSYLDSFFYFRNLWNWVSYRFVFTVWNKNAYPATFQARHLFHDDKLDNKSIVETARKDSKRFKAEVDSLLKKPFHQLVDLSHNHYNPEKANEIRQLYDNIFEPRFRSKTLCIVSTYNPRHLIALPKNDQKAYKIIVADTLSIFKSLGYYETHTQGLVPEDYVDIMHFVASGGNKIARQIEPDIKNLAKINGYLDKNVKS